MALEDYRVIDYPEKTSVDNTDYVLIDSSTNGTNKYQLSRILAQASAEMAAQVAAEAEAREAADDALQDDIDTRATSAELAAETAAREAAVTELKADLGELAFSWVDGKFVNFMNGAESVSGGYSCTSFILCSACNLFVKTEMYNDSSGICFYDLNYNFISGYNSNSDNYKEVAIAIPDTAVYVRISALTRYKGSFVLKRQNVIDTAQKEIGELKTDVNVLNNDNASIQSVIEKSRNLLPVSEKQVTVNGVSANYNNGTLTVSGTASASGGRTTPIANPFTLQAGNYTFWANDGGCYVFIEKVSDNSIIANIAQGNAYKASFVLSEETQVYIGINVDSGNAYDFTCELQIETGSKTEYYTPSWISVTDSTARKSLVALDEFWAQSMWKVLCIGDSLTSGASYAEAWGELAPAGDSIDQNYPRILGRLINGEVTNAGFSGYSASSWYNNQINNYAFANYDTFIIWLGTNNGLTDTLDVDVNPYDDYHDFAQTETGYYCKIIEAIKEANKSCMIVLTKVFVSKGNATITNAVIDKIAEKYSLPVIDNSDLSYSNYPKLHANVNNPHFGKAGYIFVANRYVLELSKWFAEDPMRCEYGYSARTN